MYKEIGELVKQKLIEYPDVPTRTLARMIYAMNKDLFRDVETVRARIRYYRGAMGEDLRKVVSRKYGKCF